jgi:uncharacterized protein (UPF0212 family)
MYCRQCGVQLPTNAKVVGRFSRSLMNLILQIKIYGASSEEKYEPLSWMGVERVMKILL